MDGLHRKRALAIGIVHHWVKLVAISLIGSAWCALANCRGTVPWQPYSPTLFGDARLALVCFWTIRSSVKMCEYVVTDKSLYNADVSITEVRAGLDHGGSRAEAASAGNHRAAAVPLHHEELRMERALGHVHFVRPAKRGAVVGTRSASAGL